MATFPKPLCELKALWGSRGAHVSQPASCPADPRTSSSATALPPTENPERKVFPKPEEVTKNG
jgi:hypothetical protein